MAIKINSSLPPASRKSILSFESFYKIKLPESFLRFFENHHGAIPEKFIININGQDRVIERFLCLLENPSNEAIQGQYDIGVVITQIEDRLTDDEDMIGANIIPFASVFGGDFLCMDFRGSSEDPAIVLWDHNESDELEPITYTVNNTASGFFVDLR